MDHVTAEANNVVERYLMGQLAAEEADRFEEHYLDCPQCLEKLELTKQLHQGLKTVAAEDGANLARTAVLAWLSRRGRAPWVAFALVFLVVTILPWALLAPEVSRLSGEHGRLEEELARALAPQAGTSTYFLSPERSGPGEEPSTRITLGPTPEWVVLALQAPPSARAARYRLRLREAESELLWQSGPLEGDGSGRVMVSVHSSWLEAADYVVELDALTSEGGSRHIGRFTFQVRRDA